MAIKKSITHKCKYLQVLPRLHERVASVLLSHVDEAVGVPVADALNTCLVVHASHPLPCKLVKDIIARIFLALGPLEVFLQPCT